MSSLLVGSGLAWRAQRPFVEIVWWLVLAGALALLWSIGPDRRELSVLCGVAVAAFGVRVFIGHGGPRVTVLGLMSYAVSMFVGVAGVYAALDRSSRASVEFLTPAILAGLVLSILTALIGWPQVREIAFRPGRPHVTRWLTRWGVVVLLILIVVESLDVGLAAWLEGGALVATVMLAVGVLWRPDARLLSPGLVGIAAAFGAYTFIFHTGGGRLRIVALACAIAILTTARFPRAAVKWAIVAATPFALFLLARQRLTLQEQLAGYATDNNGLESMLVPVVNLAVLVEEQAQGRTPDFGAHLLSIPTAFFPEEWVAGAPQALGYQLVEFQNPDRLGTGFTTAGTIVAEPVFSFGLVGILLAAPVLAWLLRTLDNRLAAAASVDLSTRSATLPLILWAMVGGAVADLAWSGTHTLVMRTVLRLPIWFGSLGLAHLADGLDREEGRSARSRTGRARGKRRPGGTREHGGARGSVASVTRAPGPRRASAPVPAAGSAAASRR